MAAFVIADDLGLGVFAWAMRNHPYAGIAQLIRQCLTTKGEENRRCAWTTGATVRRS